MASILIVDDEPVLGRSFEASLADDGHQTAWVASAEQALTWLADRHADLALVDYRMPGMDGLQLLDELVRIHPDTTVVMMTAHGDVRTAVQAMKAGAADFLSKPVDLDAVSLVAGKHLQQRRLEQSQKHEQRTRSQEFGLHHILGECPEIEKAKALIRRMCRLDVSASDHPPNLLITGETGTGKDLVAKAFHYEGPRRKGAFVQVNCAALPEALVESELFGHTKGAFTDASTSRRGLFEVADQGTLFLDEIGSLSLPLQAKILTAIETRRIRPVGSVEERWINIQLIAALNQDPQEWVNRGRFREDLYHRLRVIHVHLPPLRDRGEDLFTLSDHFLADHCRKFEQELKKLGPGARKALKQYHWPGNVRELRHRLESAVLLSNSSVIDAELIPAPVPQKLDNVFASGVDSIPLDFSRGPISFDSVERKLLETAWSASKRNLTRAAELLDLTRDTLRYRLKKYGFLAETSGAR